MGCKVGSLDFVLWTVENISLKQRTNTVTFVVRNSLGRPEELRGGDGGLQGYKAENE